MVGWVQGVNQGWRNAGATYFLQDPECLAQARTVARDEHTLHGNDDPRWQVNYSQAERRGNRSSDTISAAPPSAIRLSPASSSFGRKQDVRDSSPSLPKSSME